MTTIALPQTEPAAPRPVAPFLHTVVLVVLFLVLTFGGAMFQHAATSKPGMLEQHPNVVPLYLSLIAAEWGLLYYVWQGGLRKTGTSLRDLIGGRWRSWKDIAVDVAIAFGAWAVWTGLDFVSGRLFASDRAASINTLLPQRPLEIVLWIALSLTAGICEEVVFRGYFMAQFRALVRNTWVALLMQSLLFGIAHGYQGVEACVKIAAFGALFGLLAMWRKSLRPGIMAHAWTDIASGLFRI